jgi:hypothetical protein
MVQPRAVNKRIKDRRILGKRQVPEESGALLFGPAVSLSCLDPGAAFAFVEFRMCRPVFNPAQPKNTTAPTVREQRQPLVAVFRPVENFLQ